MIYPDKAPSPEFPQPKEINIIDYKPLTLEEKIAWGAVEVLQGIIGNDVGVYINDVDVYIKGGYVRDMVIANKNYFANRGNAVEAKIDQLPLYRDIDLCMEFGENSSQLSEVLSKIKRARKKYKKIDIDGKEYSINARLINVRKKPVIIINVFCSGDFITSFELTSAKRGDINEYDFRCNALVLRKDKEEGTLILEDITGNGINDILNREIHFITGECGNVEDKLKQNPFLILKYIRLSAEKGFKVNKEIEKAIKNMLAEDKEKNLFKNIDKRRIWREVGRIFLLGGPRAYGVMWELGLVHYFFPNINIIEENQRKIIQLSLLGGGEIKMNYTASLQFMSYIIKYLHSDDFIDFLKENVLEPDSNIPESDRSFVKYKIFQKYIERRISKHLIQALFFLFILNQENIDFDIIMRSLDYKSPLTFRETRLVSDKVKLFYKNFEKFKNALLRGTLKDITNIHYIDDNLLFTFLVIIGRVNFNKDKEIDTDKIIENFKKLWKEARKIRLEERKRKEFSKKVEEWINSNTIINNVEVFEKWCVHILARYFSEQGYKEGYYERVIFNFIEFLYYKIFIQTNIGTSFDFDEAINRTNAEVYNEIKKELDKLQKKDFEGDEK